MYFHEGSFPYLIYYKFISRLRLNCSQYGPNIVKILSTICFILTIWWTILRFIVQHIVNFDNIVTIYDNNIVTQYGENCQYWDNIVEYSTIWRNNIVIKYDNNIAKMDNMLNNFVRILFTILSNFTTLLLQYCYFVTMLWTILRSVMAKAGDVGANACWTYDVIHVLIHKRTLALTLPLPISAYVLYGPYWQPSSFIIRLKYEWYNALASLANKYQVKVCNIYWFDKWLGSYNVKYYLI